MTRFVDRGAITAAYVGIGMAVTIGISFLLVIPIEPIYWLLAAAGRPADRLLREPALESRRGPWRRIIANGLFAGDRHGLTPGRSCCSP